MPELKRTLLRLILCCLFFAPAAITIPALGQDARPSGGDPPVTAPETDGPSEETEKKSYADQMKDIDKALTPEEIAKKKEFGEKLRKSTEKVERGFVKSLKAYVFFLIVTVIALLIWKMFYSD